MTPAEKRHYKTVQRNFEKTLRAFVSTRDWKAVQEHFHWYGSYLRFNPEALEE